MKIDGTMPLGQIKRLHEEARALSSKTEKFEDMETNESIKEAVRKAWGYFNAGDFEKAEEYFGNAIKINPRSLFALLEYGTAYGFKGKFKMAIKKYEEVLKIDRKCEDAYCNLGEIYRQLGRMDMYIKNIVEALDINIGHELAYEAIVEIYIGIHKIYIDALHNHTNLLEQAKICVINSKFVECLSFLAILIFFEPENNSAHDLYKTVSNSYEREIMGKLEGRK